MNPTEQVPGRLEARQEDLQAGTRGGKRCREGPFQRIPQRQQEFLVQVFGPCHHWQPSTPAMQVSPRRAAVRSVASDSRPSPCRRCANRATRYTEPQSLATRQRPAARLAPPRPPRAAKGHSQSPAQTPRSAGAPPRRLSPEHHPEPQRPTLLEGSSAIRVLPWWSRRSNLQRIRRKATPSGGPRSRRIGASDANAARRPSEHSGILPECPAFSSNISRARRHKRGREELISPESVTRRYTTRPPTTRLLSVTLRSSC